MSVHASGRKRHGPRPGQQALVALLLVTALVAPAWSWVVISAPADARQSVALAVGTAGIALCAAVVVAAHQAAAARAARDHGTRADATAETLEREADHLIEQVLPALAEGVREGRSAREVLARHPQPGHAALHRLAHAVGTELDAAEARAAHDRARRSVLEEQIADLDRTGLPLMVTRVREDRIGAAEALQDELPTVDDALARLRRHVLEELLAAARRSASAMEAASASGARIQAHLTTLLARLRELQDRYGDAPGIFGDLLDLDHGVSRTGRLTDGFVVLAGGRSGRRWTRPIVMESILRGAMGRISAYRRVRLHNVSTAAIAGYAAEGVMQALAELMDNAANFSAYGTEVHVYVQEEDTGLTVIVEDGGLGMRMRERRLAESLVTHPRDLSTLRGNPHGPGGRGPPRRQVRAQRQLPALGTRRYRRRRPRPAPPGHRIPARARRAGLRPRHRAALPPRRGRRPRPCPGRRPGRVLAPRLRAAPAAARPDPGGGAAGGTAPALPAAGAHTRNRRPRHQVRGLPRRGRHR